MLRAHPDHLVRDQGARHVLGHVEHRAQPGRLPGAHRGRHRRAHVRLEVRCAPRAPVTPRAPSPDPHGASAVSAQAPACGPAPRAAAPQRPGALCGARRIPAAGARRQRAQTLHRVSDAPGRARAGMWVPGLTGLVVGAGLLLLVRDSPEAVGYPPVETVQAKPKQADGASAPKESLMSLLLNNVLKNPFIWGMAFTYFFVYVVRQGVTSWFVFYLIKARAPARVRRAGRVPRRPGWRDNVCSVRPRAPASVRSVLALELPPC